ncbi:tail fiber domain-containing protein [bacterium]|nr:tail fiber domain-containing protein [bacterium]
MKRILIILLAMWSATVFGTIPQLVNYQGFLTDSDGSPLDTVVAMTFKMYDAASSGTQLWTETQPACTVRVGLFNVLLGSVVAIPDSFGATSRWLGVTVGGNSEMVPRTRFVSVGYAYRVGTVDGASGGTVSGDVNIVGKANIGSGNVNTGAYGFVVGYSDTASGDYSTISGGKYNTASGNYAAVCGGWDNDASILATVGGGQSNTASGGLATVGGGYGNTASGTSATVDGGEYNDATAYAAAVGGGRYNRARGAYSVVAGGGGEAASDSNSASGDHSAIGGGMGNAASGDRATVGGGYGNDASGYVAAVGGGYGNTASRWYTTVGGGWGNEASAQCATVGGGNQNRATVLGAEVGGGYWNSAVDTCATISGGYNNYASAEYSTVGGGRYNRARGNYAVIAGGGGDSWADSNSASGNYSAIPGGRQNVAAGRYSFAAGRRAKANHDGSFVWADSTNSDFASSAINQFNVRASGGVRIATTTAGNVGVKLDNGDSAWEVLSDSTKKTNRRAANTEEILAKVAQLPIEEWNYKHQDASNRHVGPMAQDFWSLFHLGDDSLSISTIDPDGIALAAIQELAKQVNALKEENQSLRTQVQTLMAAKQESAVLGRDK